MTENSLPNTISSRESRFLKKGDEKMKGHINGMRVQMPTGVK